ncbi:MAG: copper resistance CopC/CopD family protein [Ktedonobacteraceae bacterium]
MNATPTKQLHFYLGYHLMGNLSRLRVIQRLLYRALPLAFCLLFLFPSVSEAHAILLRSDPAKGAVLSTAPTRVRMWFTESLNPTYSTARILNGSRQRVDQNNAHVVSNDQTEMDVNLSPNLPPAVYVVIWRTQSADDGHVLTGSFIFTVANSDGSTQKLTGAVPGQDQLGSGSGGSATGQLDGPTLFSLTMVTLVELGVVFWVGAQLWRAFILQLTEPKDTEQQAILQSTEQRFDHLFSLPTLLVIFFADIGVLIGQALFLTGGQLAQAFSPSILLGLISSGQFGTYWLMRQIVILLAILVTIYTLFAKRQTKAFAKIISWINLLLGLALLIALTLSGHAAAVSRNIVVLAVLSDWLHLLAASLWIGGMMYIATTYLPTIMCVPLQERIGSLLSTLPRYTPLAIAGVIIMSVTGPVNATTRMNSVAQLLITPYGRVLIVKVLLVGGLLLTSAFHIGVLRPKLAKDYKNYKDRIKEKTTTSNGGSIATLARQEVNSVERSIERQGSRLINTLRWEPLLGVAVLLCTGLLTVFSGTLVPATTTPVQQPVPTAPSNPFTTTVKTTDTQFTLTFNVTPNHFGNNEFTVSVLNSKGQPDTSVGVSLYNTMLDMDMGTRHLNLQPDGQGHFKGSDQLDMSGHWQVRIDVRTPNGGTSHATVNFSTPNAN